MTGSKAYGDALVLEGTLYGWNTLGQEQSYGHVSQQIPYRPWMTGKLEPFTLRMPDEPGAVIFATELKDAAGSVLHRNFTTFTIESELPPQAPWYYGKKVRLVRIDPAKFSDARWSLKQWNVRDGLKVNGAGSGFVEYTIPWPSTMDIGSVESATFIMEASAKQLFGKDQKGADQIAGEWMRGEGTLDPSLLPNAYPMTDETLFPSSVTVSVNDTVAEQVQLADDPADHRGILSWQSQPHNDQLREAGSYGELVSVPIPRTALNDAAQAGELVVRLEVDEALPGGLAIYGEDFGRYPVDPTVVFLLDNE
ncbi:MAG: hypothetical protein ACR2KU_08960 [Gammaproteobacteria bacterium]